MSTLGSLMRHTRTATLALRTLQTLAMGYAKAVFTILSVVPLTEEIVLSSIFSIPIAGMHLILLELEMAFVMKYTTM